MYLWDGNVMTLIDKSIILVYEIDSPGSYLIHFGLE